MAMKARQNQPPAPDTAPAATGAAKALPPAAERALAEAAARRAARDHADANKPKELSGPEGRLDPTRYGDWEVKGLATDF
jgi:hypothetical protein